MQKIPRVSALVQARHHYQTHEGSQGGPGPVSQPAGTNPTAFMQALLPAKRREQQRERILYRPRSFVAKVPVSAPSLLRKNQGFKTVSAAASKLKYH